MSALIALQLLLVGGWWIVGRDDGARDVPLFPRLDTGVPAGTPLMIETGLPGALEYARAWADDAFLFAAAMQVEWPSTLPEAASSEIPPTGWILYTFGSANHQTLSMLVDRQSGLVIDEDEMDWSQTPNQRLSDSTYPISSVTALFATETVSGQRYRNACPEFRQISRVSLVPNGEDEGNGAYWLISYEDRRSLGSPAFTVRVDAQTGAMERDERAANGEGDLDLPAC